MKDNINKLNVKQIINIYGRVSKLLFSINRKYMIFLIIFTVLLGVFPSISILLLQKIINEVQIEGISLSDVSIYISIYILIDIVTSIISNVLGYFSFKLKYLVSLVVNKKILDKASELELADFENSEVYNLIQRAQGQSGDKIYSYFIYLLSIGQSIITVITSSYILFTWNMWVGPLIGVFSVIRSLIMVYFSKKQYLISRKRTTDERKKWYYQFLLTNDIAFKEIKLYNLSQYFIQKFESLFYKFIEEDNKLVKLRTIIDSIISILDKTIVGGVFFLIIKAAISKVILVGDVIAYIRSMSSIKSNVESLLGQIVLLSGDTLYISEFFELLEFNSERKSVENSIDIYCVESIKFNNVSYKYKESGKYVLKCINFEIKKGDLVAFVGRNGSGKSTLVKILSGFYDDYTGDVYINDINIRKISKVSIRNQIGLLFQDFTKYELTLRENIALGNLESSNDDNKILRLLKENAFDEKSVPNIDNQLGYWFQDGTQLSGGQWMKVALARTFIRDASLYILDEPNASLDNISEKRILQKFKNLSKDKVSIFITHRLTSSKDVANKIILMDKGEIIKIGIHEDLINTSSLYKELYNEGQ
ncbi:MAG: ABC transporter ATP-binding protein [Romboutsia sp.]